MNLDDALAGAEMAKQYPVAPAMPIQQPSDPARQHSDSSRGASLVETPQSSGQVTAPAVCMLACIRLQARWC